MVVTLSENDLSLLKRGDVNGISTVMVAGCIDYISPLSRDHHQTPFVYELHKLGTHPHEWSPIDANAAVIPADQLGFAVHPLLTWNAD